MLELEETPLDDLESATEGLALSNWVISPYLDSFSIADFCRIARGFVPYETVEEDLRSRAMERINSELSRHLARPILHYSRVSAFMATCMRMPTASRYSHLIEMAIIEQYKLNHPAALFLALPIVDGLILAMAGWTLGDSRLETRRALAMISPSRSLEGPSRRAFEILHRQLSAFVHTVYQHTSAGLGIGNLNRHNLLHALGSAMTTVPGNLSRVLMAIEVLVALEQLNETARLELPIPDESMSVDSVTRESFYEDCVRQGLGDLSLITAEFLSHHALFDRARYYGDLPRRESD